MTRRGRESLRRAFRPAQIQLLFAGEAPPVSGRFFYRGDSGLYRAMRDAFAAIDPSIAGTDFLSRFREAGCYLVDLCPEPVDRLAPASRRAVCRASEASFARTITQLQPKMIATLVRSIEGNVIEAASRAGWRGPFVHLPYPGRWDRHRKVFVELLQPALLATLKEG